MAEDDDQVKTVEVEDKDWAARRAQRDAQTRENFKIANAGWGGPEQLAEAVKVAEPGWGGVPRLFSFGWFGKVYVAYHDRSSDRVLSRLVPSQARYERLAWVKMSHQRPSVTVGAPRPTDNAPRRVKL